ncbi:MAG: hypothetical protein IJ711_06335 [Lachnospiraceae bacterium]|nr:hypothetical protein [Lachnospiraceae bacterium]
MHEYGDYTYNIREDGSVIDLTSNSLAFYTSGVSYHGRGRCAFELDLDKGSGTSYFAGGY